MSTQNTVLEQLVNHMQRSKLPESRPNNDFQTGKRHSGKRSVRAAFVPKSNKYKELTPSRERVGVHGDDLGMYI